MSLKGRAALLTGASGGIGGALGRRLIQAQVRVAFAYGGRAAEADRLVAEANDAGLDAVALGGDLADPRVPALLVREAAAKLGPIEILIANASHAVGEDYVDVDPESWDRTIAVNLRAPFLLCQQVMPQMVERGFGRILFMSSIAGFTGGVVGAHYAASKAGLHGLVHYLAPRVAPDGVTVNALAPALIEETRMLPKSNGTTTVPIPVGRYGRPGEVADMAMAIMHNGYLTNQVVSLDGGLHPR